ncbi:MAG: hypothetical protein KDD61_15345 [Bdellovibrionales bacterium]|nr:hypothetical protein [Bdellovibrionales bacterium]
MALNYKAVCLQAILAFQLALPHLSYGAGRCTFSVQKQDRLESHLQKIPTHLSQQIRNKVIRLVDTKSEVHENEILRLSEFFRKALLKKQNRWTRLFNYNHYKETAFDARDFHRDVLKILKENEVALREQGLWNKVIFNWQNRSHFFISWLQFTIIHGGLSYLSHFVTGSWWIVPLYAPQLIIWNLKTMTPTKASLQYSKKIINTAITSLLTVSLVYFLLDSSAFDSMKNTLQENMDKHSATIAESLHKMADIEPAMNRADHILNIARSQEEMNAYIRSMQ